MSILVTNSTMDMKYKNKSPANIYTPSLKYKYFMSKTLLNKVVDQSLVCCIITTTSLYQVKIFPKII